MQDLTHITASVNKEHLTRLIDYGWADELESFEEEYNVKLDKIDWSNKEQVAKFINICIKKGRTGHIFYTMVQLDYSIL